MRSKGRRGAVALLAVSMAAVGMAITGVPVGATSSTGVSPPSSIADDCASDATAGLVYFFATLPAGSTVDLPANACYLVSNGPDTLRLNHLRGLTINGNGATFEQRRYEGGVCGDNTVQPVLTLTSDKDLTFNKLTLVGPGNCGGSTNEGDYGIELGQATPGNSDITFDGVTVEDVDGDGLAVLPQLGTCCGINTDITFENGKMSDIGYHTITPEGVNGLTIHDNHFTHDGNFMDMEVDTDGPGDGSVPTGVGQWNVTVSGNTFSQGAGLDIDSLQGACIPQRHVTIVDNVVEADGGGMALLLGGSESPSCERDRGLTIYDNDSLSPRRSPCGASIESPPGCSMIEVADYSNVTIAANVFTAFDGTPTYFPNTISVPCITLQGVDAASITYNVCANAWDVWDTTNWQFEAAGFASTSVAPACGNTYGLTHPVAPAGEAPPPAAPQHDAACP